MKFCYLKCTDPGSHSIVRSFPGVGLFVEACSITGTTQKSVAVKKRVELLISDLKIHKKDKEIWSYLEHRVSNLKAFKFKNAYFYLLI